MAEVRQRADRPKERTLKASRELPDIEIEHPPPVDPLREANEHLTLATIQAHEQADRLAQRYRDLVEGLDVVVWEAEADPWRYTFVSQRVQTLLGYPPVQWYRDPNLWFDLIHPDDRQQAIQSWKTAISERRAFRLEYRALAADGGVIWLANVGHFRLTDQNAPQFHGLLIDITDSKQTEHNLHELIADLEASKVQLYEKVQELEGFHDVVVGRELKMMELKIAVARLQEEVARLTSQDSPRLSK